MKNSVEERMAHCNSCNKQTLQRRNVKTYDAAKIEKKKESDWGKNIFFLILFIASAIYFPQLAILIAVIFILKSIFSALNKPIGNVRKSDYMSHSDYGDWICSECGEVSAKSNKYSQDLDYAKAKRKEKSMRNFYFVVIGIVVLTFTFEIWNKIPQ